MMTVIYLSDLLTTGVYIRMTYGHHQPECEFYTRDVLGEEGGGATVCVQPHSTVL